MICRNRHNEFTPKYINRQKKEPSFCSNRCSGISRQKNGRYIDRDGYVWIRMRNHPFCNSHGRIGEHRIIAEKALGRFLKKDETVHHFDNNHSNNQNHNLLISKDDYHIFYTGGWNV